MHDRDLARRAAEARAPRRGPTLSWPRRTARHGPSFARSFGRPPAGKVPVEIVEHGAAALPGAASSSLWAAAMPAIRLRMPAASSRPYLPSLRSMSWMISPIAASAGSSRPARRQQHLEGAAIAVVRELAFEHVEAQFARPRRVARARHELEARAGVDEAADQPGRGDAVDLHALPRHPDATLQSGGALPRPARRPFVLPRPCPPVAGGLRRPDTRPSRRFALVGAEEVDGDDRRRAACAAAPSGWRSRPARCRAGRHRGGSPARAPRPRCAA